VNLPEGFPPIKTHACDVARREPGYVIVSLGRDTRATSLVTDFEALVALDPEGKVAWFWRSEYSVMDVKLTPRSTLLVVTTDGCIQEINFQGEALRKWFTPGRNPTGVDRAIPVDTLYFHHAVRELPNGNLAALSIARQELDDYPLDQSAPDGETGTRTLVGDTLVEFQPDGTIVNEFSFFDILDPRRFSYGLDAPFWSMVGVVPGGADWTHANGLVHDPSDDSFIITVRHQDCAIKIDRQSGELKWILGAPGGWNAPWSDKLLSPVGETTWHWHPHDPSILADGSIMLFDNGAAGAIPPEPPIDINSCISRALAYRVDENAMTVEQVWSFGEEDHGAPYAMYISGAYELPSTGNIFVTYGGITLTKDTKERTNLPPLGHGSVELFEVTRDESPRILFHAEINNRETDETTGWGAFRSEWVPAHVLEGT